jgi:hypothetical protein
MRYSGVRAGCFLDVDEVPSLRTHLHSEGADAEKPGLAMGAACDESISHDILQDTRYFKFAISLPSA